jgi:spermidine/putrescine transport system substrate-binding protein
MSETQITRQELLRRAVAGSALLSVPGLLAACGGGSKSSAGTTTAAGGGAKTLPKTITFSNWPLYIDVDEKAKTHPSLIAFEKHYGVKVKYLEDINDNDSFFGKIEGPLSQGQSIGRDIIVLTDSSGLPGRMIELGWLEKLDKSAIPNFKNLQPTLRHPNWDENRDYSLPWQSGMTGIGYNPKKTGGKLTGVDDLFDPRFKGRVTFLTEWRDSTSLMLLADGKDLATATKDDVLAEIDKLEKAASDGQIRRFTGNDYAKDLAAGNVWACVAWSGDIIQLQADNPDLEFLIPETGAGIWSDNMMIPAHAEAPYGAETWMNYYYDPAVAAKVTAYVNYFPPISGMRKEVEKLDPGLAENQLIFPDEATQTRLHPLVDLTGADNREVTARMQEVAGA